MSPLKTAVALSFLLHLVVVGPVNMNENKDTATLEGTITNPQGMTIQGAKIGLTCASSNIERQTITDAQGRYKFEKLPPAADCVLRR